MNVKRISLGVIIFLFLLISMQSTLSYSYAEHKYADKDASFCETLVEDKNMCYFEVAEAKKDVSLCEKLYKEIDGQEESYRNLCYHRVAVSALNESICEKTTYKNYPDQELSEKTACYTDVAEAKKDYSICDKITKTILIPNCYEKVTVARQEVSKCTSDECLYKIAHEKKDLAICKLISGDLKIACYHENTPKTALYLLGFGLVISTIILFILIPDKRIIWIGSFFGLIIGIILISEKIVNFSFLIYPLTLLSLPINMLSINILKMTSVFNTILVGLVRIIEFGALGALIGFIFYKIKGNARIIGLSIFIGLIIAIPTFSSMTLFSFEQKICPYERVDQQMTVPIKQPDGTLKSIPICENRKRMGIPNEQIHGGWFCKGDVLYTEHRTSCIRDLIFLPLYPLYKNVHPDFGMILFPFISLYGGIVGLIIGLLIVRFKKKKEKPQRRYKCGHCNAEVKRGVRECNKCGRTFNHSRKQY